MDSSNLVFTIAFKLTKNDPSIVFSLISSSEFWIFIILYKIFLNDELLALVKWFDLHISHSYLFAERGRIKLNPNHSFSNLLTQMINNNKWIQTNDIQTKYWSFLELSLQQFKSLFDGLNIKLYLCCRFPLEEHRVTACCHKEP